LNAVEIEEAISDLAEQTFDSANFPYALTLNAAYLIAGKQP